MGLDVCQLLADFPRFCFVLGLKLKFASVLIFGHHLRMRSKTILLSITSSAAFALFCFGLAGCASFESRFTSQTGCPEEEILVIKKSHNFFGNQAYTVACRGKKYYCTEDYVEKQHSNLTCTADRRRRRPSSLGVEGLDNDSESGVDDATESMGQNMTPLNLERERKQWYRY